jgi:hypothetical protein
VQFLASLTTLTTLILRGCSLITDQGVQSLASLTGPSQHWTWPSAVSLQTRACSPWLV